MPPGTRYQDDEEDEELFEEIEPPKIESGFSKAIIVDNIPVVPAEKFSKLLAVLKKVYESIGPVQTFHVPQDDKKNTLGYCFVEFEDAVHAELAIEKTNGYKLDKSHNFKVSPYNDLARYSKISDTYQPAPIKPYERSENVRSWLLDERGCDQFVTKAGDVVEIFWNDKPTEQNVESVLKRDKFTESYVQWSPRGTYLVTMHARGVQLWAGAKWERVARLTQLKPVLVDFSPCENYVVTASSHYRDNDNPADPQCIIVWSVRTGRKLRGFLSSGSNEWPVFKWSHDDKYVARLAEQTVFVYQAPSMELVHGKPLELGSAVDAFAWSPSDNTLSYFVAETDDKPASVVLVDVPSRKERRKQNLFSVKDCRMHWHPSGDFLCVKVDRWTKNKKNTYTNFEVFRMRVKDIPIEQLELKVAIHAFAWEPKGTRFALIHGEQGRMDVSFYTMDKQLRLLKTLEKKAANALFWSPQGQHIILAGLGQLQGQLEFFDANTLETMGSDEHYTSTSLEWDPTGRYVASTVSFWKHQVETGYKLYSFQGRLLKTVLKDKFFAFSWRPRPPSLLSDERIKHIQKNIKQLAQDYKKHDLDKRKHDYEHKRALRLTLRNQYVDLLQRKLQLYNSQAAQRRQLLADDDDDQDGEQQPDEQQFDFRETYVEELLEQHEINIDQL